MDDLHITDPATSPKSDIPPPSYDVLYNPLYPHQVFDPPYPPPASAPPHRNNPPTEVCRAIGFDIPIVTGRESPSIHAGYGKFPSKSSDFNTSFDYGDCHIGFDAFTPRSRSSYSYNHCYPPLTLHYHTSSPLNRNDNHTSGSASNLEQGSSSGPHSDQQYLHSHGGSSYDRLGSSTHHNGGDHSPQRCSNHHGCSDSSYHRNSSPFGGSSHHGDSSHRTDGGYHGDSHHGGGSDHRETSGGDHECAEGGGDWGGGGDSGGGDCGGGDD